MFAIGLMGMRCRLLENWEEEGNKEERDGAEAGQGKVELSIG